jgi:hypothetical protein
VRSAYRRDPCISSTVTIAMPLPHQLLADLLGGRSARFVASDGKVYRVHAQQGRPAISATDDVARENPDTANRHTERGGFFYGSCSP